MASLRSREVRRGRRAKALTKLPTRMNLVELFDAEWALWVVVSLLTKEDAIRLALMAIECELQSLRHALLFKSLPISRISTRTLADYAAKEDWWDVLTLVLRDDPYAQHKGRQILVDKGECAFQQCLRFHLRALPAEGMYEAIRRDSLADVKRLYDGVHYDANTAIHRAARSCHFEMLQWLLIRIEGKKLPIKFTTRLEDSELGMVAWRCGTSAYYAMKGVGDLPLALGLYYPLMDMAALNGDLVLLEKLHNDPVGTKMCSSHAMEYAVCKGHLDAVRWPHKHRTEHLRNVVDVARNAIKADDTAILEWAFEHFDLNKSIPSLYAQTFGLIGRFKTMRWLVDHFRDVISQRASPRLYDLYSADLDLIQLVYEMHNMTVDVQAATSAARRGNLEAVRWMVKQDTSCLLSKPRCNTLQCYPE